MTKEQFLEKLTAWASHRPMLWKALEATRGSEKPVIELGSGPGSTNYLRQYCQDEGRKFVSYESDRKWAVAMKVFYVVNWDDEMFWNGEYSVCLLDLAPGEYRKIALMKIQADIIVIHDSEPIGWNASDYKVRPLFTKFKYMVDDKNTEKGSPWTTMLSNTIDVSQL